jgi:uncharacterized protein (TIGR00255 family)
MMTSMTGFASVTHDAVIGTVGVTIRTVNHRHLDLQVRAPAPLQAVEPVVRTLVQQVVARGRVEMALTWTPRETGTPIVEVREDLLLALEASLRPLRDRGIVDGPLTPGDVLRLPHVLVVKDARAEDSPEHLRAVVEAAVAEALEALATMRRREGGYLEAELSTRHAHMASLVDALEIAAQHGAVELDTRLRERLRELRLEAQVDELLVAQEVVKFVARSDVREELVRLRAHLDHWRELVAGSDPCGRKLDFLLQEMNREVNTIGAKAEGTRASALVVDAKAELEKMREQVQNVE